MAGPSLKIAGAAFAITVDAERRILREDFQQPVIRAATPQPAQATAQQPSAERGSPLDPQQTFNSFITGGSNRLAHAAKGRVLESC